MSEPIMMPMITGHLQYALDMQPSQEENVFLTPFTLLMPLLIESMLSRMSCSVRRGVLCRMRTCYLSAIRPVLVRRRGREQEHALLAQIAGAQR